MRARSENLVLVAALLLVLGANARADDKAGVAPLPTAQGGLFNSLSLGSRKEPIRINSDSLELDYKGSTLIYSGAVQVRQGDVTLSSERLAITYDRDALQGGEKRAEGSQSRRDPVARIKKVVAEGNVRIRQGERMAEGNRAVFDQAAQTIVLSNGAVLHEGPNQVEGDRIVVYLREERSVVEGDGNSRVKAVLYPDTAPGDGGSDKGEASARAATDGTLPSAAPQR